LTSLWGVCRRREETSNSSLTSSHNTNRKYSKMEYSEAKRYKWQNLFSFIATRESIDTLFETNCFHFLKILQSQ
jgi:hypothetical protein